MEQHGCDMAFWQGPFRETRCSVLGRKVKCTLQTRGELTYIEGSTSYVPDWSVLMQMRTPNLHSLIGPKSTVLIGRNGVTLIDQ